MFPKIQISEDVYMTVLIKSHQGKGQEEGGNGGDTGKRERELSEANMRALPGG